MKFNIPQTYELLEEHPVPELMSEGYILKHKKTGARVVLLSNDDDNKVFYIGFRTPPTDSTGVAHILEHSVLCGSKNFPVKDPFIELAQGSLNTFLNAMTYPDKTVYPVASCNLQDLKNLMHVYMDAVFYPNIHKEDKIFYQEGWHYHLENPDDDLIINGVVYNEMKGAFSSPDDVHDREVFNSLYPDSPYGVESGGDPEFIPDLTYEDFKGFHNRYYHPSNSYIYLYGDMDMEERLIWMDKEYLSAFDAIDIDSAPKMQEPFKEKAVLRKEYPIAQGQSLSGNTYLSYNTVIGNVLDKELYLAFQILDYALCSSPGAPLKKALTDAGIGTEVYSIYENCILQPYFSIVAKNTDEDKKDAFLDLIMNVLKDLVKNGINKKSLLAAINYFEFKYKESDFGAYPKGLIYGLQALDSWLYDDMHPFMHIESDNTIKALKEKVGTGYYEELLQKYLIDNTHSSLVIIAPNKELLEKREADFKKKMADHKASLSDEGIKAIVDNTHALMEFQEEENDPDDLSRIPLLSIDDLDKKAREYKNRIESIDGIKVLFHDYFTRGICYLKLLFDLKDIPAELFPYLPIHKAILGLVDTKNYTYDDLYNDINIKSGGMSGALSLYSDFNDKDTYSVKYEVGIKTIYDNIPDSLMLLKEVTVNSLFEDKKRIKDILSEIKSQLQAAMAASGHTTAVTRAMAALTKQSAISELFTGIEAYRLLASIEEDFDNKADDLIETLKKISSCVFRKENLIVDITMGEDGRAFESTVTDEIRSYAGALFDGSYEKGSFDPKLLTKKEGFTTPGMIQYVCCGGNFAKNGLEYTGALKVLKVIMSYDYLWSKIRVKGGAYGCMCGFGRHGSSYFVSYRDPHLKQTIEAFKEAPDYIRNFEADERTLTKFIIGAISAIDTPLTPAALGARSMGAYLSNLTYDDIQKERDEVLGTTERSIRDLGDYLETMLSYDVLCVVGAEGKIKENSELFDITEGLF